MFIYKPKGVCSREIAIALEGETIQSIQFVGGCNGNLQGLAALACGMQIDDYIARCGDIKCGAKNTSCPAQLALALKAAREA